MLMAFSSSLPTLKLNNGKNPKLNIKRETILSSTKQAPIQVDKVINKSPKKLRKETVLNKSQEIKGSVHYIFASLFFKSKRKRLSKLKKCFLFHFKSSFYSRENQILEFYIFKFHDVIKCRTIKQEIRFTE